VSADGVFDVRSVIVHAGAEDARHVGFIVREQWPAAWRSIQEARAEAIIERDRVGHHLRLIIGNETDVLRADGIDAHDRLSVIRTRPTPGVAEPQVRHKVQWR
jgi:hypothetical protein